MTVARWYAVLMIAFCVWIAGCGEDETPVDDVAPTTPVWVERSPDNVYPQAGIRAEPVQASSFYWVRLEWFANPEPDILGYRMLRVSEFGDVERPFVAADLRLGIDLEPGLDRYFWVDNGDSIADIPTNLLAPNPEDGTTRGYYWTIEAYDTALNKSARAPLRYYRLINNPYNVSVTRSDTNTYAANWSYLPNPDVLLSYYMLRVYRQDGGLDSVVWWLFTQRYQNEETVMMDFSQVQNPLIPGRTYVCQINAIANGVTEAHRDSLAGSAVYTTFVYQN